MTIQILENLKDFTIDASDLIAVFLTAGYGASVSKIMREAEKRGRKREMRALAKQEERRIRHRYQNLIYKLKKGGLIKENEENNQKVLIITRRGEKN